MTQDPKNSEEIRALGMTDAKLVDDHIQLGKEKHPPTKGFLQAPLIFVFVFGCLIFVCSIQLAHSTNSFRLHPEKEEEASNGNSSNTNMVKKNLASHDLDRPAYKRHTEVSCSNLFP